MIDNYSLNYIIIIVFAAQAFVLSAGGATWNSLTRDILKRDQTFSAYTWQIFFALGGWCIGGGLGFILYHAIDDTGILLMDAAILGGVTLVMAIVSEPKKFTPPEHVSFRFVTFF